MIISCNVATTTTEATLSPFSSISTIFDSIGKIGTPKNTEDYLSLNWTATTTTTILNSVVLNIFYSKVGAYDNHQYAIITATVSIAPVSNRVSSLYIQFS